MPRSKNKVASRERRRRVMELSKGYWGERKNVWTVAKNHVEKGLSHAYRDRRLKRRNFRRLWIIRINAAARLNGTTYSRLVSGLKKASITIDRKILSEIAIHDPG